MLKSAVHSGLISFCFAIFGKQKQWSEKLMLLRPGSSHRDSDLSVMGISPAATSRERRRPRRHGPIIPNSLKNMLCAGEWSCRLPVDGFFLNELRGNFLVGIMRVGMPVFHAVATRHNNSQVQAIAILQRCVSNIIPPEAVKK